MGNCAHPLSPPQNLGGGFRLSFCRKIGVGAGSGRAPAGAAPPPSFPPTSPGPGCSSGVAPSRSGLRGGWKSVVKSWFWRCFHHPAWEKARIQAGFVGKGVPGGPQSAGVTPGGVPPQLGGCSPRRGLGGPRMCVCVRGWSGQCYPSDPFYPRFTPIAPQRVGCAPSPREDPAPLRAGALRTRAVYLKSHFFLEFYTLGSSSFLISWKCQRPPGRLLVINHSLQWLTPPPPPNNRRRRVGDLGSRMQAARREKKK